MEILLLKKNEFNYQLVQQNVMVYFPHYQPDLD